jgi:hypothetical protein
MLKGARGGKRAARQRRHAMQMQMQSLRTQKPRDAGQGDVPWAVASGLTHSGSWFAFAFAFAFA